MNLNFLKNLLLKGKLTVEGSAEIGTSNIATGTSSFAQGSDALASGARSFAQGLEVTASGAGSHAEGYGTVASGLNSHAEGIETDATGASSHTEGNNTSASGTNTHAEGNLTIASGDNSHAEGNITAATALGSHAEGNRTATGKRINYNTYTYSTKVFTFTPDTSAEFNYVTPGTVLRGYDSVFLNEYFAFTVLNRSTVTGNITAVEAVIGGNSNNGFIINNSGEYAHVEGFESIASGLYSHAEGDYTEASGEASHAEGSGTIASGNYSHAEGGSTIASGNYSHAEGGSTIASGNYSHAEGSFTEAKGNTSHAAGYGATAGHNYSYVWSDGELGTREPNLSSTREGQYVIDATGGVYIPRNVGIGTDSIDNALTVVGTISTSNHGNSNQWNSVYNFVQNNSAEIIAQGDYIFETNSSPELLYVYNKPQILKKVSPRSIIITDVTGSTISVSSSGTAFEGNITWNIGFGSGGGSSIPSAFNSSKFHINYSNLNYLYTQDYTSSNNFRSIVFHDMNNLSAVRFPDLKLCGGISLRSNLDLQEINFNELEYVTCIGGYGFINIGATGFNTSHLIKEVNFPKLKYVENNLEIGGYSSIAALALSSINVNSLEIIGGYLTIGTSQALGTFRNYHNLTSINMPNIVQSSGFSFLGLPSILELNFPKLKKMITGTSILLASCSAVRIINCPELEYSIGGYIYNNSSSQTNSLTSIQVPKLIWYTGGGPTSWLTTASLCSIELGTNTLRYFSSNFTCNQTLLQQSVDNVLKAFARLNGSNGTVLYSGTLTLAGNNASPSYTGGVTTTTPGSAFHRTGNNVIGYVASHGHTTNEIVTFTGNGQSALNGTYSVRVSSIDQFEYTTTTTGNLTGSGTVTMRRTTVATDGFRSYQTIALRGTTITINMP